MYRQGELGVRGADGGRAGLVPPGVQPGKRPVVCFDETSRQLTGAAIILRPPLAAAPGRVARYDTEYQRNGTRNRFMICEPRGGKETCGGDRAPKLPWTSRTRCGDS